MSRWNEFWDQRFGCEHHMMAVQSGTLLAGVDRVAPFTNRDVVLDYGCGPGYLVARLKDRVRRVYGVDTSTIQLEHARVLCGDAANVTLTAIQPGPQALRSLERLGRDFDKIVCCSVLQYLKPEDLDPLLATFVAMLKPGGQLVLADVLIGRDHSLVKDAAGLLRYGWKHSIVWPTLRMVGAWVRRDYFRYYRAEGLQTFERDTLVERLEGKHSLKLLAVEHITAYPTRSTFICTK